MDTEWQEELKNIGRRAKAIRYRKGITQREAQRVFGINSTLLSKFENGRINISLTKLLTLRQAYDCQMSEFFCDEEDNKASDLKLIAAIVRQLDKK